MRFHSMWANQPVALLGRAAFVLLVAGAAVSGVAVEPAATVADERRAAVAGLDPLNSLIGEWRGIGLPKRGSQTGSWQEKGQLVWDLKQERPAVVWSATDGQQLKSARWEYLVDEQKFRLTITRPDDSTRVLTGGPVKQQIVLESAPDEERVIYRLTLSRVSDDRVLWLFEKRLDGQSFSSRIAEVAYQRQGTRLAAASNSGPECVVTGGLGTIAVEHKGQRYYVCCSGCQEAFHSDPEGILAEYREKKKKAAAQANGAP